MDEKQVVHSTVGLNGAHTENRAGVERDGLLLRHYAKTPVSAVESRTQKSEPDHKPTGFWVSVDSCEDNWREWCESENFGLGSIVYGVALSPDARILHLSNAVDLLNFTREFADETQIRGYSFRSVKWARVAEKFQGIVIAPYIWSMRLDDRVNWYYSWDCASGCVWDATAIVSVTPCAPPHPAPVISPDVATLK